MCGIVGAAAVRNVVPVLMDGLKRLEYRGYDSAGVAVMSNKNSITLVRSAGKVQKLAQELSKNPIQGQVGIAHTRWATHGKPCEQNAHPHMVGERIAIVHNGIIENYETIYAEVQQDGYQRQSETDTEAIAAWVHKRVLGGDSLLEAVRAVVKVLVGAYAIALIDAESPGSLVVARQGSPLVIGVGIDEYFLASDPLALQKVAQDFIYLEEGDIALIKHDNLEIYDAMGNLVTRTMHEKNLVTDVADKGEYRHFMQKEIFEQPRAITETLIGRIHNGTVVEQAFGRNASTIFAAIENVQIVACGTSYYAGLTAKYWLEEIAGIPCNVEIASEFRYRKTVVPKNTLFVTLSQSGETADTLAALRSTRENVASIDSAHGQVKSVYLARLVICNVPESSLVRESDLVFLTHAGPEVGVASTKAFMTQLIALQLLSQAIAKSRQRAESARSANVGAASSKSAAGSAAVASNVEIARNVYLGSLATELAQATNIIERSLQLDSKIQQLAKMFIDKQHALFLGRGACYPLALEGALKLKEISYIHAEAYPAGELKHGPLALVDSNMPVVVLAPQDGLFDKIKANMAAVAARGGNIIAITTAASIPELPNIQCLTVPQAPSILMPLVMAIPMQLLAYHVAVAKGTDVDHPRNLAKSVTVE